MIRLATIEEIRPSMKVHLLGKIWAVHASAHFWEADTQGKGFLTVRDDQTKTAETIAVYRGEKLAIE